MRSFAIIALLLALYSVVALAQSRPCTEQDIRHIITPKSDDSLVADDAYIFSPAFDKPIVGKAEIQKAREPVLSSRTNEKHGPWKIERIVQAPSGEMAYEYGTRQLSFDDKQSGKHMQFTNAYLRVWKAVHGGCKIAATMYGHEREGAH
jgi:ketosteroid isomerase-like protein